MAGTDQQRVRVVGPDTTPHRDTHVTRENAPERPGINAQTPSSMPRSEDDEATLANSPAFHDRPGSGRLIADRQKYF